MSPLTLEQLARIFHAGALAIPSAGIGAGDAVSIALGAMVEEALRIKDEEDQYDERNG